MSKPIKDYKAGTITCSWIEYDDNDDEQEVEAVFPAKNEVCYQCNGFGTHVHPGIDSEGHTQSEFRERFEEPEDREAYFSGAYDVSCDECHGRNVILVIDEDAIERDDKLKEKYSRYCEYADKEAQYDAEYRAYARMEREMGC